MQQRKPFNGWAVVETDSEGVVRTIFCELHQTQAEAAAFKKSVTPRYSSNALTIAPITIRINQKKLREMRKASRR